MSLEGKAAFVIGASRPHGIGRATALTIAREGADVAVSGWSHEAFVTSLHFLVVCVIKESSLKRF